MREQQATITHFGRQHGDVTIEAGLNGAFVNDFAGAAVAVEGGAASHEGGITHVHGGCDNATNVNLSTRREVDACGVDQINLAVGTKLAEDLAGVVG